MQTRLYSDLYALIQALCGIAFSTSESIRIKSLINRRAERAYKASNYWTRFIKVGEERYCTPDPVAVTTTAGKGYFIATVGNTDYSLIGAKTSAVFTANTATTTLTVTSVTSGVIALGDAVFFTGVTGNAVITAFGTGKGGVGTYTISASQSTATARACKSFTPDSYFLSTGIGSGTGTVRSADLTVPYSATGFDSIDSFLRIYAQKPYKFATANEMSYYVTSLGAELSSINESLLTVFVTYKKQLTDDFGDGTGEVQNIPYEWFNYLAHGVYADFLRAEGQQEKCQMADAEANEILTDELMKLDEQHTQTIISNRISTNSSMQYRSMGYGS
jgi:hypothetical protein